MAISWTAISWSALPAVAATESAPVVLHDCLLVFRFGSDPRYGVTLQGSEARAINAAGHVVGWAATATGAIHAVLWTGATTRDLGTLGGANSCALGINAAGQVVGWAETASGERHAVRWDEGEPTDLGTYPGEFSVAYAINDAGQAVGLTWPVESRLTAPMGRAVLWDEDGMTDIGPLLDAWGSGAADINARGEVVGWMVAQDGARSGFVWSPRGTALLEVPDAACSAATAIDDAGRIAGWAEDADADGARHAILWIDEEPVRLDRLTLGNVESDWAVAYDVNARASTVGAVRGADDGLHAVLWPVAGAAVHDLGTLGGSTSEAYALNDAGQIVGWALTAGGEPRAFCWQGGVMTELPAPPIDATA